MEKIQRFYIDVPFIEKDDAKNLGAQWDPQMKKWYYVNPKDTYKFSKWESKIIDKKISLSDEQQRLIELAKEGKNVLVDACIGSGKTTAIQMLCNEFPEKNIIYLTYNRLLKQDAKEKIKNQNVLVQNYHGLAYKFLKDAKINAGVSDLIQIFLKNKEKLNIPKYDMLVLDEYQDIEQELADMLIYIKEQCPNIQIIAVGDMKQKIYDKTTLNVPDFINKFLGDFESLNFTKCFRLSDKYAKELGSAWGKAIKGVNENCKIEKMNINNVIKFLKSQNPGDILCLGSRNGNMAKVLNQLEKECPEKFNKHTAYASIQDEDGRTKDANKSTAIFTTYDSSKGLERKVCVIFDFMKSYWDLRVNMPDTNYEILRNIFLVAASRGKDRIIYVKNNNEKIMSCKTVSIPAGENIQYKRPFNMSEMFSFKYKEDVEECYRQLKIEKIDRDDNNIIDVKSSDGLIDLSPCIGILQEASFFGKYDIDNAIQFAQKMNDDIPKIPIKDDATLEDKVLYLTAYETHYTRYVNQVKTPFVDEETLGKIHDRLKTVFSYNEDVQKECKMIFHAEKLNEDIVIKGIADVKKDNIVYELKFVSELSHEHFLQCACYVISMGLKKGILWNIRDNKMYAITIPEPKKFLMTMIKTITKGYIKKGKFKN